MAALLDVKFRQACCAALAQRIRNRGLGDLRPPSG